MVRTWSLFLVSVLGFLLVVGAVIASDLPLLTEGDLDKLKGAFGERITVEEDPGHHQDFILLDGKIIGVIEFEDNDDDDESAPRAASESDRGSGGGAQAIGPIDISGPAPFVDVFGTVYDDGTFTATGQGTVAGFPNVTVEMEGTIGFGSGGMMDASYTMGAGGELPGGFPITYGIHSRQLRNGDLNCEGHVDAGDALELAKYLAQFSVSQTDPCPEFGDDLADLWVDVLPAVWADINCDGDITLADLEVLLEFAALLPVDLGQDCVALDTAYQPVP